MSKEHGNWLKTMDKPIQEDAELQNEKTTKRGIKATRHKEICEEINQLYIKKNHDYGDSFGISFQEEGMAMVRIRLGDKLNRFKTLTRNPDHQQVGDESVRDTLIDMANYAIMAIIEMEDK